jgi:signal transduction histidine kinase/DNA-binding response OmpR family regulator
MNKKLSVKEILVYGFLFTLFVFSFIFLIFLDEPEQNTYVFFNEQSVQIIEPYTLRIGVLVNQNESVTNNRWQATAEYLENEIDNHLFEIVPLEFDEVEPAVKENIVDFILVNSSMYVDLEVKYGVSRIATLNDLYLGQETTSFGSVIFTLDAHPDIGKLNDINDHILGAVNEQSFGGWQMALKEFSDYDIKPDEDFKDIIFTSNHEAVVEGVLEGTYDVGIVRTGVLEEMFERGQIDLNSFTILSENTADFPYVTSTQLYPEWPIARTAHISDDLAYEVAFALMQLDAMDEASINAGIAGWVIPENYQDVHSLLKLMKLTPYENYGEVSTLDSIYYNRVFFFVIIVILAGLTAVTSWLIHTHSEVVSISKRAQKMEQKAQNANEAKGEFLAHMSHEIRTPISAIIGLLDLMNKTKLNNRQRDYYNKLRSSAVNLLGILNNVLDYSKIESQKMTIEKAKFDIYDILYSLSSVVSVKTSDQNVEFLLDIPKELPHHYIGDSLRLNQVLLNFVSNALKFTTEGQVILSIKQQKTDKGNYLLFMIQDSGVGLTQNQINNILKPFTQADTSITRKYGGTGLGLSISYELINLMGGDLRINSTKGKGSTFSFALPLEVADERESSPYPYLDGYKVMIIDDNQESLRITNHMCEEIGLDTRAFDNAQQAYQMLLEKRFDPDILIIDYIMPEMNGNVFVKQAINNNLLRAIKGIIMVSAYRKEEVVHQLSNLGIDEFLDKPLVHDRLYRLFYDMLNIDYRHSMNVSNEPKNNVTVPEGTAIILAEDNPINKQIAYELLSKEGFDVDTADNGFEVIELLEKDEKAYQFVLMDIQMPQLDGRRTTMSIRKNPSKYQDIPIIAMSAHAIEVEKKKSIQAGMNDYITKPFEIESLVEKCAQYIDVNKTQVKVDIPNVDNALLDTKQGISNMLGDELLYHETLKQFYDDYSEFGQYLRLLRKSNFKEFKYELDVLSGLAETIGASHIYTLSQEIEITNESDLNDYLLDDFITGLEELIETLDQWLKQQKASS